MSVLERWLRSDFAFLLGLTALQAAVIAGPFLVTPALSNDTLGSYGLFYDQLDSLSRFGEPAWWGPHVRFGTPTYFFGILNIASLGKPAFVAVGFLAWLLGRLGVALPSIYPFYVFYFGVLIPFLLLLGIWLVARALFRSRAAVRYVLAVGAFSPAVLLDLSDPGVTENAAYGLMCTAAYLRFVAAPSRRRFFGLCAAAMLVAIAPSSTVAISAAPMLVMVVGATLLLSPAARAALRSVRLADAVVAVALLGAVAAPSAIAYGQLHDRMVNAQLGTLSYSYGELKAGNPIQLLLASTPGAQFDWDSYRQDPAGPLSQYRVVWGSEAGIYYLGMLALPLAATGLVHGRRRVRRPLFVMLVATGAVFLLFASSPLLAPLLLAFPVLGTINHFGDQLYHGCGFLVLLFAAGLGLEAAERSTAALRWLLAAYAAASAGSLALVSRFADLPAALGGFIAFIAACTGLLLLSTARLTPRARSRAFGASLIALTLLDVATVSFWYVRPLLHGATPVSDRAPGARIGSSERGVNSASEMFGLRPTLELLNAGFPAHRLPYLAGYCAAHVADAGSAALSEPVFGSGASLPLPEGTRSAAALAPFFAAPRGECKVTIVTHATRYNTVDVSVEAAQPALLFLRDSDAPGWTARVDGAPAEIYPAFGAFKAVVVPAGASRVELRFRPPYLGAALLGAYTLLVATGLGALWLSRREAR